MKYNTMLIKYIIAYIITGLAGLVLVSTLCYDIDYKKVYNSYSKRLYTQSCNISRQYALEYLGEPHLKTIENQVNVIAALNETRIFFIKPNGDVILDTGFVGNPVSDSLLYNISDFDYGALKGAHSAHNNFYNIFNENVISVYSPINNSFETKAYTVICMSDSVISSRVDETFDTNYITLGTIMLLSLSFLFLYIWLIHRPIKEIIKATNEYGKGNLAYHLKPKANDELGRLSVSLDYMASQLNEMDIFQQKFLSNISHDFRSPLTSIKGYLEAIQDGTVPPEMINKYIQIILFETDRLTKLTSNILTLNEMDPKTVRLEKSTFDLNSVIRHTVETFEGTCKKKNIKLNITYANEIQNVKADKSKIQQVIYNLIDNAIKFSPDNSEIFITVKEKGDKAYISVKDCGVGIAKEDIDKIWDRFYKSDSSRGRDKKGSGLGLSITKEIIQAHDETIDVISTIGVGTEFIFTLNLV